MYIALSILFQMGYCLLLPYAYKQGDMSQVYPIMRGTGALLVPILSVWIYGEALSPAGWAGIACIVLGLYTISGMYRTRLGTASIRSLVPALTVGLCITGYVMVDKMVLESISPFALIELANIVYVLVLTPAVLRSRSLKAEWKTNLKTILLGSIFSPGSYLLFLLAVQLAPLSHLAPIREMGTVFGTLFGVLLLKEAHGLRRVTMSAVITAGVIIIGVWGNP